MTKTSFKKRIRIFAGPNGSGKTTIINGVREEFQLGHYINADDIEQEINISGKLSLAPYDIIIDNPQNFHDFSDKHGLTLAGKIPDIRKIVRIDRRDIVAINKNAINSYVAALIADFLRQEMLEASKSFSFETVMSDERKLDFAQQAKDKGYRVYLYFVATISPEINISRVSQRVKLGGHNVDPIKIRERYEGSLSLLYNMIKLTDRAYLFDNSGERYELVAEITDGKMLDVKKSVIPNWVYNYFYMKALENKEP